MALTPDERKHAESITDPNPLLAPIPPLKRPRILVGAVIRKPPEVLEPFLTTLKWQAFREPVDVDFVFVTDYTDDPWAPICRKMIQDFGPLDHIQNVREGPVDYAEGAGTRMWTAQAMHRVGALKNRLIQFCLDGRYDGLWLVDADVLCDPRTLQSLMDCDAPVVAGVYWTHWRIRQPEDMVVIHAAPQVWLRHPYGLSGHGFTEATFRDALVKRSLVQVWGLGACTLFSRAALEKGVSFLPIPEGLPPGPMADGEDRHLSERARRLHLPLYADGWPDIYHAYHPAQYDRIPAMMDRLAKRLTEAPPQMGDLVNLRIDMLEPIPQPKNPGVMQYIGAQYIRGRIGIMGALPEMEEAIASAKIGERKIVKLHFPAHWEYETLRNQSRLVSVTLFDRKPFGLPPEIDQEMFVGKTSGSIKDATQLEEYQVNEMMEASNDPT